MRLPTRWRALALFLLVALGPHATARAALLASFGTPTYVGSTAQVPIEATFSGAPADTLEALQLSLIGSDPALTAGGTDFSRFAFAIDGTTLVNWSASPPDIGTSGFTLLAPNDPINGPFLSPSAAPYNIGLLTVDLAGLVPGSTPIVTLAGNDPLFPTEGAGTVGGSFGPIPTTFGQPGGLALLVPATAVPEPGALALAGLGAFLATVVAAHRRRQSTRSSRSPLPQRRR